MPLGCRFWWKKKTGEIPAATAVPDGDCGNPVFYANNLSVSGDIDAGLSCNQLELFPGSGSPAEKTAALCNHLPSAKIPPATYTMVRAGKIRAGMPLEYPFSESLLPNKRMARSEEHTSELQSLMRISYDVCGWKKKK